MSNTAGSVPTDQTGSSSSEYTNGLVEAFELFAKRGAEIAADALTNRDGRPDRGTGGGDQAGENGAVPWYKQPLILGAAAVALVLILVLKKR